MAIAKATNGIENANQIKKVIFSLPYDWVENDKIKPDCLQNLKKLSQELDLSPLGFVVTSESIIHYLQKNEGSPLTAILVGFSKDKIFVTLVHAGKKEDVKEKQISENIVEDFKLLLSGFPSMEIFPSRILLFNHRTDLEKVKEDFLAYAWQKFPGFLHFPKVEILERDTDLKSAVLAGITELGIIIEPKSKTEEVPPNIETIKPEEAVFTEGKDVLDETPKKSLGEETSSGIIITDIQDTEVKKPETFDNIEPSEIKITPPAKKDLPIAIVPEKKNSIIQKIKSFPKTILIALPIAIFVISAALISAYWYLPKAKVTLVVESRKLEKNLSVKIASDIQAVDEDNRKIPANSLETEVTGQKATTATGTKTIGDKAKGEVTIYNKTNNSKTFAKGTEIIGAKNLKFTLDDDIYIASSSSSADYVETPGKSKVKVTASQIGTDSNLNSSNEFTIKGYSTDSYPARNEQNFSGGTSREVTVITKEDQSRIKDALTKELEDQAKQTLKAKLNSGEVILEKGIISTVKSSKFDKELDSEAKDTTLNLTLSVKALFYKDSDLKSLSQKLLEQEVPDGYDLKIEDINIDVSKVYTSKDETIADIAIKTNLLPRIDTKKIQKDIAGKFPDVLSDYFKSIPSLSGYEIKLIPELPKKIATTPRIPDNISIVITAGK